MCWSSVWAASGPPGGLGDLYRTLSQCFPFSWDSLTPQRAPCTLLILFITLGWGLGVPGRRASQSVHVGASPETLNLPRVEPQGLPLIFPILGPTHRGAGGPGTSQGGAVFGPQGGPEPEFTSCNVSLRSSWSRCRSPSRRGSEATVGRWLEVDPSVELWGQRGSCFARCWDVSHSGGTLPSVPCVPCVPVFIAQCDYLPRFEK